MTSEAPIFIDFEASSLDLVASYPIEVGICHADGRTDSWLIKPHVVWREWSERAARIHNITREELDEKGKDVAFVARALNQALEGKIAYSDAWTFDSFWLHRLFKAAKIEAAFELESIAAVITEDQVENWQTVRDKVIGEVDLSRHRAANDALILHKTWLELHS